MAKHYGFDLDVPLKELPKPVYQMLFYGTKNEKFPFIPGEDMRSRFRTAYL
jgi:Excinuclease ATPase subunit